MNEKQAKLLRYFETNTGDHAKADQIRKLFDFADHRTKGKITRWLKKIIVTMLALKKIQEQKQAAALRAQIQNNLNALEGFSS